MESHHLAVNELIERIRDSYWRVEERCNFAQTNSFVQELNANLEPVLIKNNEIIKKKEAERIFAICNKVYQTLNDSRPLEVSPSDQNGFNHFKKLFEELKDLKNKNSESRLNQDNKNSKVPAEETYSIK
ncbi:hypothetical protein C2G38_2160196 [Gigaspora rosea]|uniref:Uncharacterized protein n=1 Tax=Gigaspora rosea TaxID=44941 RepID=A0A397W5M6_9GLOM|nr:hypothetical protein C2G38_2160196 [Gigaspora rosea]